MRVLNENEIDSVSGGHWIVTVVIAVVSAGYLLGKDAAERDNRRDEE